MLDKSIIELLQKDGRTSSAVIARTLNEKPRTIQNRIQRLVDQGVIQPVVVVHPAAFGYTLTVDIFCEVEAGFIDRAVETILSLPNVTYLAISTGEQDLSLQATFRSSDEMQEFITQQLHQAPGIRRTRTVLLPRILKDTYQWMPPPAAFRGENHLPEEIGDGKDLKGVWRSEASHDA